MCTRGLALLVFTFSTPGLNGASFVRGDVNGDGRHALSDPITLVLALFGEGLTLACRDAGDFDDNGMLKHIAATASS